MNFKHCEKQGFETRHNGKDCFDCHRSEKDAIAQERNIMAGSFTFTCSYCRKTTKIKGIKSYHMNRGFVNCPCGTVLELRPKLKRLVDMARRAQGRK